MNPKCLVDVILCAWPPSYMKSLARKQYSNALIGTRYLNAVIWLVRDKKNHNAAIWLVRDKCTYPNVTIFSDGGNTTLYTDLKFFSYKKKKNLKNETPAVFSHHFRFRTEMFHKLGISRNWSEGMAMCTVYLWKASSSQRIIYAKAPCVWERVRERLNFKDSIPFCFHGWEG